MKEKATKLATLIIRWAAFPEELERFQEDREGYLGEMNLNDEVKVALLEGDMDSLRNILESELGEDFLEIFGLPGLPAWGVVSIFIRCDEDEDEDEAGD